MRARNRIYSNSFSNITEKGDLSWCDGMISGNGVQGVISSGAPYTETLIYQNIHFIMPSDQPRHIPPEVTDQLDEARQAVISRDDTWNVHGRQRTFDYCFHPSHQLRLNIHPKEYTDYKRWTDYETAEIGVCYSDSEGEWERKTFASREDDVIITSIQKSSSESKVSLTISIDEIKTMRGYGRGSEKNLDVMVEVMEDSSCIWQFAKYPYFKESELNGGGYCGVTYVICEGGRKKKKDSQICITDADAVYLISKSDRTFDLSKDNLVQRLLEDVTNVAEKYRENGLFHYEKALKLSSRIHKEMFDRVSLSLGNEINDCDDEKKHIFCEDLLEIQRNSNELQNAMVETAYQQGRYAMICCAGDTMSRLCGMWTGEWNSPWNGIYTMDANVNLQSSAMNTGNLLEFGIGYINFVLRQIEDWKENARMVYRMEDALLVPVNFDGNRAMMVEYDWLFPFQYWNAGASWMLQPIYEWYQCFGNREVDTCYGKKDLLSDILLPLLTLQTNFWRQLVTPEYYMDVNGNACYEKGKKSLLEGEKYLIIPSYSPENNPKGRESRLTANASMDIAAAKDGIRMTINIEKAVKKSGWQKRVDDLQELDKQIPDYMFDESGALREWAAKGFEDNHEHRHISHLYCAWPAFETQDNPELVRACKQAIINRNIGNKGHDDFSAHGWLHKALVFARLKDGDSLYEMIDTIMHSNIYYKSMMSDHNTTGNFAFCTDTSLGMLGVVNEALLYSDERGIEVLPSLPKAWSKGCVKGLMARCHVEVEELSWDVTEKQINIVLNPFSSKTICVRSGIAGVEERQVALKEGEKIRIQLS